MRQAKESLDTLMQEEIVLLDLYSEREEELKTALYNRDWQGLEASIRTMSDISSSINRLDVARDRAFAALRSGAGLDAGCSFYRVVLALHEPERTRMTALYRQLKLATVRLKVRSAALDEYIRSEQGTLRNIIGELHPERRGRIYSRTGESCDTGSEPLVLNHTL